MPLLGRVAVAPITTTIRGVPSEVRLSVADGMKTEPVVNLHNLVTVARESLGPRVAAPDRTRLGEVCEALAFALVSDG
jgi:mRNA interferase MazF